MRNASGKPQWRNGMLLIPVNESLTKVYYYDKEERRMYRGEKGEIDGPDPDISEMKQFMFDDGQILFFDFESSYDDSNAFVESELTLNAKVWCKITMKILYTEKFSKLTEEDKVAYDSIVNDLYQSEEILNSKFTSLQTTQEAFAAKHGLKLE